eukprot:tig00020934_g16089.t1
MASDKLSAQEIEAILKDDDSLTLEEFIVGAVAVRADSVIIDSALSEQFYELDTNDDFALDRHDLLDAAAQGLL